MQNNTHESCFLLSRSFGIVLWEIITLGQVPYSPLNNQQVISLITTTQGTLEKPVQCTETL
jgi:hypothetical protein